MARAPLVRAREIGLVALVGLAASCGPSSSLDSERRAAPSNRSIGNTPLPCAVADIFDSQCSECHGAEPAYGAPMALVTWEDLQRASRSNPSERVYQRIRHRIHDAADPMPPPPRSLSPGEKGLLETWIDGYAPQGGSACTPVGMGGAGGVGGGTGGVGGVGGGMGGVGGSSGSSGDGGTGAVGSDDCEPIDFVAHGQPVPADPSAFPVAPGAQVYQCFYFKAPWNDPVQALKFNTVIDNKAVIHHWLLYGSATPTPDGSHGVCAGVHPDAVLLAGWAPGATDVEMPPGVGMELPYGPNAYLILEVHYTNTTGSPQTDRSGARVCATKDLRPETATVSWLGTELIFIPPNGPGTAASTCTPNFQGQITILRSWPHMHKLGRSMKTEILRAGGGVETLIDVPNFDFDYQFGYDTPAVLNPGDRLSTTCGFQNPNPGPVTFGPRTEDEMCYNFVTAYPAGALTSIGLMARACGL